jgi:hypothetical protein
LGNKNENMRINHRGAIERERAPFMVICKEMGYIIGEKSFLLFYLIKMRNGSLFLSLSWSRNETNRGNSLFYLQMTWTCMPDGNLSHILFFFN